jgi:hypothetical protein
MKITRLVDLSCKIHDFLTLKQGVFSGPLTKKIRFGFKRYKYKFHVNFFQYLCLVFYGIARSTISQKGPKRTEFD